MKTSLKIIIPRGFVKCHPCQINLEEALVGHPPSWLFGRTPGPRAMRLDGSPSKLQAGLSEGVFRVAVFVPLFLPHRTKNEQSAPGQGSQRPFIGGFLHLVVTEKCPWSERYGVFGATRFGEGSVPEGAGFRCLRPLGRIDKALFHDPLPSRPLK